MAKKKVVAPKPASADALRFATELLAIAETDLCALSVLHSQSLFPQAVFYLQQAVEKIGKAYGLAMGITEVEDLQKDWSHNTLKHSELLADYREQQGMPSRGLAPEKMRELLDELRDPHKMTAPAMRFFVQWAMTLVEEYRTLKNDSARRNRDIAEMTEWAVADRTDPEQVAKASAYAEHMVDMLTE